MKDTKIQWHPGFVAAMNLELTGNRRDLIFEKEYNLNTKPLEIDLLIIKKSGDTCINNEIGRIFRGHNILEYKSPKDHLNIDSFYKGGAYASLYKSYGKTVDAVKADDITVSFVRETRPEKLFRYFDVHNYSVSNPCQGIYYIDGNVLFPTQIIVTKELNRNSHVWLRAISPEMAMQDMRDLLESVRKLTAVYDRGLADSVMEVSIQANAQIVEELKGDESMVQALMEIMEPQLLIREEKGIQQGIQKGISGTVDVLRDLGHKDTEIEEIIKKKYDLTDEEARSYL